MGSDPEPTKRVERARELALSYLDRRMRSRFELARYLRGKGYTSGVIEPVLAALAEIGVLDDRAFARAFARDRVRLHPRGYRRIAPLYALAYAYLAAHLLGLVPADWLLKRGGL